MRCPEARRDLFAFLDGAVSVERNLEVLEHLKACPSCGRRFEAERRFEEGVREVLASEEPPAGLRERLDRALDLAAAGGALPEGAAGASREHRSFPFLRRRGLALVAAAAGVLFAVGLAAAWATCTGPFQCAVIRSAASVAARLDRGEAPLCVLGSDRALICRTIRDRAGVDVQPWDLSSRGFTLEGCASVVPADPLPGTCVALEYRSVAARAHVVQVPIGDHVPRSWNLVREGGRDWYEAWYGGYGVVGWTEPGGTFRAVVSAAPSADLRGLARAVRGG